MKRRPLYAINVIKMYLVDPFYGIKDGFTAVDFFYPFKLSRNICVDTLFSVFLLSMLGNGFHDKKCGFFLKINKEVSRYEGRGGYIKSKPYSLKM